MTELSPRVLALIKKARHDMLRAEQFLEGAPEQAARMAYMCAFHAAQAAVLAITGKEPKTHTGLRSAFGSLVLQDNGLNRELGRFISIAYEAKDVADYQTEYDVDRDSALRVIAGAREALTEITSFLKIA